MKNEKSRIPEISIIYTPKITDLPTVKSSYDSYTLFLDYFPSATIELQERFVVMYLNHSQKVKGIYVASIGGLVGTVADTRLILGIALKTASTKIILAHNHPSGSLKPSQTDIELTSRIQQAARIMEIKLVDHLIITAEVGHYFSFSDEGLL